MASLLSVTVSMAEERTGILTAISRVTREATSTSPGNTSDGRGANNTSSKVSATVVSSRIGRCAMCHLPRSGWPKSGAPWPLALARGVSAARVMELFQGAS